MRVVDPLGAFAAVPTGGTCDACGQSLDLAPRAVGRVVIAAGETGRGKMAWLAAAGRNATSGSEANSPHKVMRSGEGPACGAVQANSPSNLPSRRITAPSR
jgi:hypothetical protein